MHENLYFTVTVGPKRFDIHGYHLYVVEGETCSRFVLSHKERKEVISRILDQSAPIHDMRTLLKEISRRETS